MADMKVEITGTAALTSALALADARHRLAVERERADALVALCEELIALRDLRLVTDAGAERYRARLAALGGRG